MKKIRFCIAVPALAAALALTMPLFAEDAEIYSRPDLSGDSEAGPSPITPSRAVTLKSGQYLDIGYPGSGWIYLGETEGSSLLKYEKRELGNGDTFFTLFAKTGGTATLHFYKSDALAGSYIDDYLTVTVSGTSRNREHVEAPSYADIVPPRPSFTQSSAVIQALQEKEQEAAAAGSPDRQAPVQTAGATAGSSNSSYVSLAESGGSEDDRSATVIQTSIQTSSSNAAQQSAPAAAETAAAAQVQPAANSSGAGTAADDGSRKTDTANLSEREILDLAKKAYESKEYQESLSYLADFFDKAVSLTDAGLYLKGQILEAPSAARNIKEALASYKALVSNYPESELWNDAAKRISYIERIYFDIR